jgi:hypothetical protein
MVLGKVTAASLRQAGYDLKVRGNSAFLPVPISDGIRSCSAPDLNRTLLRLRLSAPVFGLLQGALGLRRELSRRSRGVSVVWSVAVRVHRVRFALVVLAALSTYIITAE